MVQKYLEKLSIIIKEVVSEVITMTDLQFKHFFSGAAVYVNSKIFCTYTPSGIAVKLPSEERTKLITSKKGSELRYFAKAPVKKDYVVLSADIIKNKAYLKYWICMAYEYVNKS